MAKKKTPKPQQQLSPEKYIRTKGRNLPVVECVIAEEWKKLGRTPVIVARQHVSGNYTVAMFIMDAWCIGIKNSYFRFNMDKSEYKELRDLLFTDCTPKSVSYNEAHNLLYGALSYAEDLGVQPDKSFAVTSFLLEEDTEDIPLIEYEYGRDGAPFLLAETELEADYYLSILEKNGHFVSYAVLGDDGEWDDDDDDDAFNNMQLSSVIYDYTHPEYPQELQLVHPELQSLSSPGNNDFLNREDIDSLLALPRETLIADLEQMIRYEIGQTYDNIRDTHWSRTYTTTLLHALFLLGELRAEESFDTVLEVMRQDDDFCEYHFGDSGSDILPLTLYFVGGNQLPELLNYIKEPGLNTYFRAYVFSMIRVIDENQPERREEIIEWCREALNFFFDHVDDKTQYDASLVSLFIVDLIEMSAVELLPEIERLYETGQVDEMCCGDMNAVRTQILDPLDGPVETWPQMDIYERYDKYHRAWA